jgi:hypothetical protein
MCPTVVPPAEASYDRTYRPDRNTVAFLYTSKSKRINIYLETTSENLNLVVLHILVMASTSDMAFDFSGEVAIVSGAGSRMKGP